MSTQEDRDRQERLRRAGLSVDQLTPQMHERTIDQQKRLSALGLYVSEGHRYFADGKAGALTEHGLKLESEKGYAEKFLAQNAAKNGHRSPSDIIMLQTALNKMGYDAGKVDGLDGKNTQAALQKFLQDHPKLSQQAQAPMVEQPRADRAAGLGDSAKTKTSRTDFGNNVLPGISHRPGQEVVYLGDSRSQGVFDADRSSRKVDGAVVGAHLMAQNAEVRGAVDNGLSRVSPGDKVLISWGTNDFKGFVDKNGSVDEKKRDAFVSKYQNFIHDVKERGGEPVVLGFSATNNADMSKSQVAWLNGEGNKMLQGIAKGTGAEMMTPTTADIDGRNYHNNTAFNKRAALDMHA